MKEAKEWWGGLEFFDKMHILNKYFRHDTNQKLTDDKILIIWSAETF